MNPHEVAVAIDVPVTEWPGHCSTIARGMLDAGLVKGRTARGHWIGPIHFTSLFANRANTGFTQHSWIVDGEGRIVDPTRWVFEGALPYIYVGDDEFYDEGGNVLRQRLGSSCPSHDPSQKQIPAPESKYALEIVESLIDGYDGTPLSIGQIFWLANLPPKSFGDGVKWIYQWLSEVGCKAIIPIDNWNMVFEKNAV